MSNLVEWSGAQVRVVEGGHELRVSVSIPPDHPDWLMERFDDAMNSLRIVKGDYVGPAFFVTKDEENAERSIVLLRGFEPPFPSAPIFRDFYESVVRDAMASLDVASKQARDLETQLRKPGPK